MRVAGLVLAAGAGRRFGGPKAVVEIAGERLVDRAVRVLAGGGCPDVVVVSGAVPLEVPGASVVHNAGWDTGMASSLQVGAEATAGYDAVLVLLVDLPGVTVACVRRVLDAVADRSSLAVATYDGRWGHPVALGAEHVWPAAVSASGDQGARPYLRAHLDLVREVECSDIGDPADVDLPADLPPTPSR